MTTISKTIVNVFKVNLIAQKDGEISSINFDDFLAETEGRRIQLGERQTDFMVIFGEGESITDSHYKSAKLRRMKKADLLAECQLYEDCFYCGEEFTRADLIDILENKDHEDYYKALFSEKSWYNLPCDFEVTGYSQGDVFKVVLHGSAKDEFTEEYLQNIFFDTPNYVKVEITNEDDEILNEVYLSEYVSEYSEFDRDEAIRILSTSFKDTEYYDYVRSFLKENMPDTLDYQY